jgi:SAM-dependent methyltransferase
VKIWKMKTGRAAIKFQLQKVLTHFYRLTSSGAISGVGVSGNETGKGSGIPQEVANSIWNQRYRSQSASKQKKGASKSDPIDYTLHPFLYAHSISKPLTGDPGKWWLDEVAQKYLVPMPARLLSLGCGMAHPEEHLLKQGYVKYIVAYDTSQMSINAARERIRNTPWALRIELRCGDPLDDGLESGSFDVVFVEAAIHHFIRIEEMFQMMHRVLKRDGLLIFDEYVGPDHHQYPPDLVQILDALNACLALQYRFDHLSSAPRESMIKPPLEFMLNYDPSEGVHASRILPLTYQYFDVIQRKNYGGAIMRPFFTGILPNFDFDDPKDQTVSRLIIFLEQELTRHGILPHHNTNVVARRKAVPRLPLSSSEMERIGYDHWKGLGSHTESEEKNGKHNSDPPVQGIKSTREKDEVG